MKCAHVGMLCNLAGLVSIVTGLLLANIFLPAYLAHGRKAQRVSCVNNLKQLGIAFRLWEGDHADQFPFNLSTNAGGTLEYCDRDQDGFDRNAFLHLRAMGNCEGMTTPKLLVCPQDRSRHPAADFDQLQATNITYRFYSGTNTSEANPQAVLAECPIHGNLLFCDGSVQQVKGDPIPWTEILTDRVPPSSGLTLAIVALVAGLLLLLLGFYRPAKHREANK